MNEETARLVDDALRACMADTPVDHPDYAEIQARLEDETPLIQYKGNGEPAAGDFKGGIRAVCQDCFD